MEYDERGRMRGERYEPSEPAMEQMPRRFHEATEQIGRGMRKAQSQSGQITQRARERMETARERMAELGERVRIEPGMMWFLGLATLSAALIAALMLLYPKNWRHAGDFLSDKYSEYAGDLRRRMR